MRLSCLVLSAVLVTASFPPLGWWVLALVAWIPLMMALRGTAPRLGFRLGLLHGFLVLAISLSWLWNLFGPASLGLWLIFALFTGLFGAFFGRVDKMSGKWAPLVLALFWTGIEYFRCEVFWLKFPWITPGTALPPSIFTPWLGVYGMTFLLIICGCFFAYSTKRSLKFLFFAIFFSVLLNRPVSSDGENLTVGLIQSESLLYEDYLERSQELAGKVEMIVWPEYALSFDPRKNEKVQRDISALLRGETNLLVFGGRVELDDGTWENTSFVYGREGLLGTHVKNHPVHFFNDGEAGTEAQAVETPLGIVGIPICFDNDYQDVLRKMTRDGAEFFLVPSMDGAHWSAREHEQHALLFRHRAAENGRWIAVASTSGVTQIIDANGHVRKRLPLMDAGVLKGEIFASLERTIFQRGGWLFGPICLGLASLIGVWALISSVREKL